MTSEPELLKSLDGDVLTLTLNKPEQGNALSPSLVEELIGILSDLGSAKLCVIQGAGKHFSTGFYLSDLEELSDGDILWRILRIEHMLQCVHHALIPVVCQSHGQAVGAGADLFAAATFRLADQGAKFRMPGWNFGLALGTRRLTALVGSDNARDMLIDTKVVTAEKAASIGFATSIVSKSDWPEATNALLERASALHSNAQRDMLALTINDTRDADIAAIVRTAGQPGLKKRISDFRAKAMAERKR